MEFHHTQIFLLLWIITFWIYYFFTYGKVEGEFEQSLSKEYEIKQKWGPFFGLAFVGLTLNILLYFFYFPSKNWLWFFNQLDHFEIDVAAMIIMCGAFLLNILFTLSVGKSIKSAFSVNERPL